MVNTLLRATKSKRQETEYTDKHTDSIYHLQQISVFLITGKHEIHVKAWERKARGKAEKGRAKKMANDGFILSPGSFLFFVPT